jgi:hypothetical protein
MTKHRWCDSCITPPSNTYYALASTLPWHVDTRMVLHDAKRLLAPKELPLTKHECQLQCSTRASHSSSMPCQHPPATLRNHAVSRWLQGCQRN